VNDDMDFNAHFQDMAISAIAEDLDAFLAKVCHAESGNRIAMGNEDTEAMMQWQAEASRLMSVIPWIRVPTVIMGLAHYVNNVRAVQVVMLQAMHDSAKLIQQAQVALANQQVLVPLDIFDMLQSAHQGLTLEIMNSDLKNTIDE
jgi:hypothetical protein